MARTVAIGKQDFGSVIEKNCFYVDKTGFIKEWWENEDDVTLITRPRRFGKTLTMSMVDYFFSIGHAGRSDLFKGLSIWEEQKYQRLQGTYPVIFLSFANVKGKTYKLARKKICQLISELYDKHAFILEKGNLTQNEALTFQRKTFDMDDLDAEFALGQLSRYLSRYYEKKVIILLDEYDTPMQEAYVNGYWDEMSEFIRGLFNSTFKTNPYLERAILTGITRVGKESVFSDLNNLAMITTTSKAYETSFGFTGEEVFHALQEFRIQERMPDVKRWYDGFCFGGCDGIYNPWSIINFLKYQELAPYWANTSSNRLVNQLVQKGSPGMKSTIGDLLQGKPFQTTVDEEIVFSDLNTNENALWSLLLASGYLKVAGCVVVDPEWGDAGIEYKLVLTNMEVLLIFRKMVHGWFDVCKVHYNAFIKALLDHNLKEMNTFMNIVSGQVFSSFDTGKKASSKAEPERFYHGFVLGLIVDLRERYVITSNRESGYGRYDVMLEPLDCNDDAIILEFKVSSAEKEGSLSDTVDSALKQIIDKKYAVALESKGIVRDRIWIYGFAFKGKEVWIDGGRLADYENKI